MYIKEISQRSEEISNVQTKIGRYRSIIKDKFAEIEKLKNEVESISKGELKSKDDVKLILRKVTTVLNGLDVLIRNVQKQMTSKARETLQKNITRFKTFLVDLENIVTMKELMERSDVLEKDLRDSNKETLKVFSSALHSFESQILKIMDMLRPAISKLQLNISLKKFGDFWAIFGEINKCLDQIDDWSRMIAKMGAEKIYKVVVLQDLEAFEFRNDIDALTEMRTLWDEKTKESEALLEDYAKKNSELKTNLDFSEEERKKVQVQHQEKASLLEKTVKSALDNYQFAYTKLNNIGTIIQQSESELTDETDLKINDFMQQLRTKFQTFSNLLEKTESIKDATKKQQIKAEIAKKIPPYLKQLETMFDGIIPRMNEIYTTCISKAIQQFSKLIKNSQNDLEQIRVIIDNLELSTSKEILFELIDLSQDQVGIHQELVSCSEDVMMHREFISNATKKVQEFIKKIDTMYSIHQAKMIQARSVQCLKDKSIQVTWKLDNPGRIGFQNLHFTDLLSPVYQSHEFSPSAANQQSIESKSFVIWDVTKLDPKQSLVFSDKITKLNPQILDGESNSRIISPLNTSLYRNAGKSALLSIKESNGVGVIELMNPSVENSLWNVTLIFIPTSDIKNLPNISVPVLSPGEKVVETYHYKKPQSLTPQTFHAETNHSIEVSLIKLKDKINTYKCDIVYENSSEFLIYLQKFEISSLQTPNAPVLLFDQLNEDPLEPKFTFAKGAEFQTSENPPQIAMNVSFSVQLLHEYVLSQEKSVESTKSEKPKKLDTTAKTESHKEIDNSALIQALDAEIVSLSSQLVEFQQKMEKINSQISQKQAQKSQLLEQNVSPINEIPKEKKKKSKIEK